MGWTALGQLILKVCLLFSGHSAIPEHWDWYRLGDMGQSNVLVP